MEGMVSITDELRGFMDGADGYELWCPRHKVELESIADRIDAAHRSALEKLASRLDESEDGWVRLPVDADGVPIRVGDVLTHGTVGCIRLTTKGWEIVVGYNGGSGVFNPSAMNHRAPTVEDVLREFGDWYAHTKGGCDEDGIIAEYAARLRLAEEVDR